MFIAKQLTPENFSKFVGQQHGKWMASSTVLVQDGGTKFWPRGRRRIFMLTKQGDEWAAVGEDGKIELTGRSIWELIEFHSDRYTFFYIEIKS